MRRLFNLLSCGALVMILIVDDEPDIAEELADLIASTGRVTQFVCSALDALEVARNLELSLVITDMRMPDMDGAELVRRIATIKGASVKFIIISGHLAAEEELGMLHDIPYTLFQMLIVVDRLIKQIALHYDPKP